MDEGRPAWYYVDGQLRYKDGDGWTDQYQAIDSASKANVLVAEPEDVAPLTRAEARKRGSAGKGQKGRQKTPESPDGSPEVTQRGGSGHRLEADRATTRAFRRICAVALIAGAIGIWFGMSPATSETSSGYHQTITAALALDAKKNKTAHGTAQQAVVTQWTARDLLAVIAQQGADPKSTDERPSALLALLVVGLGIGIATTRPAVREPA